MNYWKYNLLNLNDWVLSQWDYLQDRIYNLILEFQSMSQTQRSLTLYERLEKQSCSVLSHFVAQINDLGLG